MTSPDRLRQAASLLRERVEAATPGPWEPNHGRYILTSPLLTRGAVIADCQSQSDADYLSTMHPAVGLTLAEWLDEMADHVAAWDSDDPVRVCDMGTPSDGICRDKADALADLILGGAQ